MPDDTFYRDLISLIERREWQDQPPEAIDRDIQFMIFTSIEIYMNGRRGPGPRPLHDAVTAGRRPPWPRPNLPGLLMGVYGLCSAHEPRK